jgi:HK97 family phage major capsid protein
VIFGSFRDGYAIRDVTALRLDASPGYAFGTDLITLRIALRTDGKPVDATALRALQHSAT